MSCAAISPRLNSKSDRPRSATALEVDSFWDLKKRDLDRNPKIALRSLLGRLNRCAAIHLRLGALYWATDDV